VKLTVTVDKLETEAALFCVLTAEEVTEDPLETVITLLKVITGEVDTTETPETLESLRKVRAPVASRLDVLTTPIALAKFSE